MTIFDENKKKWGFLLPSELNKWNCGSPRRYRTKPVVARHVPLAHHDTISHLVGGPCIHIVCKHLTYRSTLAMLEHEMLHCALMRIGEETGSIGEHDLDYVIRDLDEHIRKISVRV
jgi:hypothetical protein